MRVTRKSSPGRSQICFFNRRSGDIIFSSLVSFVFLCILVLFFCLCLFFEIKNIYSDTHLTMRAGE